MLKTLLIGLAIVAVAVVIYLGIAHAGGFFPFNGGSGDGEGDGIISVLEEDDQSPDDIISSNEILVTLIEIYEDRIMYDGNEITLDELSVILARFRGTEYTWTLTDAFRADKTTFDSVRDLLRDNNLPVAEN